MSHESSHHLSSFASDFDIALHRTTINRLNQLQYLFNYYLTLADQLGVAHTLSAQEFNGLLKRLLDKQVVLLEQLGDKSYINSASALTAALPVSISPLVQDQDLVNVADDLRGPLIKLNQIKMLIECRSQLILSALSITQLESFGSLASLPEAELQNIKNISEQIMTEFMAHFAKWCPTNKEEFKLSRKLLKDIRLLLTRGVWLAQAFVHRSSNGDVSTSGEFIWRNSRLLAMLPSWLDHVTGEDIKSASKDMWELIDLLKAQQAGVENKQNLDQKVQHLECYLELYGEFLEQFIIKDATSLTSYRAGLHSLLRLYKEGVPFYSFKEEGGMSTKGAVEHPRHELVYYKKDDEKARELEGIIVKLDKQIERTIKLKQDSVSGYDFLADRPGYWAFMYPSFWRHERPSSSVIPTPTIATVAEAAAQSASSLMPQR